MCRAKGKYVECAHTRNAIEMPQTACHIAHAALGAFSSSGIELRCDLMSTQRGDTNCDSFDGANPFKLLLNGHVNS